MLAKYDVLFDKKVSMAADLLVRERGLEDVESMELARLVLLVAMEVEANE